MFSIYEKHLCITLILFQAHHGYSPKPFDLRNMTLTREVQVCTGISTNFIRGLQNNFWSRSIRVNLNKEVGDSVISMPHCFQALAERLAENSHDLWAKTKKQELEEIGKQSE